jgi:hypothetical protein
MRVDKIDPHYCGVFREETVLAHFQPLVVRERVAEPGRQGLQFARERPADDSRILVRAVYVTP